MMLAVLFGLVQIFVSQKHSLYRIAVRFWKGFSGVFLIFLKISKIKLSLFVVKLCKKIRIHSPNIFFLQVKIMKINKPLKIFRQSMNLKITFDMIKS